MCNPAALFVASSVATIGGALASRGQAQQEYNQQVAYARQQQEYQRAQAIQQQQYQLEVAKQANASYARQVAQLGNQQYQADLQAANVIADADRQALMARSRIKAASGEAGIAGESIAGLLNDFTRQRDAAVDNVYQNRTFGRLQAYEESLGLRAEALNRPRQVQQYIPQPVAMPSQAPGWGLTALSAASSILGNFGAQSQATQSSIFNMFRRRPSISPPVPSSGP